MKKRKVCVIGLGYIGLPTSALLANRGYEVHGVDVIQDVVDTINEGKIHIVEPELDVFVKAAVNSGKLKADINPTKADVFIIAVPTPFEDNYVPNIDYVLAAIKSITPFVEDGNIIILESTSPIGTTDKIENLLREEGIDTSKLFISHCPERVLPGHIMRELVENDRIVGGTTSLATKFTAEFYREFVQGDVLETNAKTAEMAKLTENSFRDVNISFANELSILCDKFNINVWELISLANRHPRVNILMPGTGVGGHCIAVDPWFIVHAGGKDAKLIKSAREVNMFKTEWVIEKIKNEALQYQLKYDKKPLVACLGLAFKPNIDDLRESPALYVVNKLISEELDILAVEPNIDTHTTLKLATFEEVKEKADIFVYLVAHNEFKNNELINSHYLDFCGITN